MTCHPTKPWASGDEVFHSFKVSRVDRFLYGRYSEYLFLLFASLSADDEALTRLLQTSLFLIASPIRVKSMFSPSGLPWHYPSRSFLCLTLLLFPSTCPCKASFPLHPLHMSRPQESPFLDLSYHCFTSTKLFSCFLDSRYKSVETLSATKDASAWPVHLAALCQRKLSSSCLFRCLVILRGGQARRQHGATVVIRDDGGRVVTPE